MIKPILFSTPMVQAILDGRKKVTRRVIKGNDAGHIETDVDGSVIGIYDQEEGRVRPASDYAKYSAGDILWVRETWTHIPCIDCNLEGCGETPVVFETVDSVTEGCWAYKQEYPRPERVYWHPSIHMPKAAARIFLRVTGVKVERVQDITEDDMIAEGVRDGDKYTVKSPDDEYPEWDSRYKGWIGWNRALFEILWDSINAKRGYGWATNPWVWVIEFERCEKPEGWPI